jgi:hypothetical protein
MTQRSLLIVFIVACVIAIIGVAIGSQVFARRRKRYEQIRHALMGQENTLPADVASRIVTLLAQPQPMSVAHMPSLPIVVTLHTDWLRLIFPVSSIFALFDVLFLMPLYLDGFDWYQILLFFCLLT